MRELRVLRNKMIVIMEAKEMLDKFRENVDYIMDQENEIIYVDQRLFDREMKRYKGLLTIKGVAEDVYRMVRDIESSKSLSEHLMDTIPRSRVKE